jgi:hypothetical protein
VSHDAPQLCRIAFHFNQGAAERGLLLTLGQRLLEQATKAVLLPLDPQEILNLLPRTSAWDLCVEKRTTQDLSARESRRLGKGVETGDMFVANTQANEVSKPPHE